MKTIIPVSTIALCLFALSCSRHGDPPNDAVGANSGDGVGSCTCSDIDGTCSVGRNKCKQGFKPRCSGSVDDCDCDCVQK